MEEERERLMRLVESQGEEKLRELLELESSTEEWEDLGITNEVESCRRYIPETGYYVLKGVGDIDQSPEAIITLIIDVNRKGEWDEMFVEGRVVVPLGERNRLSYQHFSAPWPVSHRDFVYLSISRPLEDGSIISLGFSVESPLVPEVRGLVRGHIYLAGFILRRIGPDTTRVTYIVHCDPRGSIPTMIINQSQKKQAQNISRLRNCLAKRV